MQALSKTQIFQRNMYLPEDYFQFVGQQFARLYVRGGNHTKPTICQRKLRKIFKDILGR